MSNSTLQTVVSADGTPIAVEHRGTGVPVVLIGGAFNDRSTVADLAGVLGPWKATITPTTGGPAGPAVAGRTTGWSGRSRTWPP